ncbi:ATP-binding protein [Massilia sp. Dwa41.01b]|uniref:ATP-binding protein n=1 Tax=unclassified Massilia TaxID=2609279 RepID=UPI0016004937|nr:MULTISPECIES: ATP-binding protein [unclassified Massilia]QNA90710.1 ATP-binding protein [Massilia sp. Dwa41.01b]QNA97945.1 ATP-binding protein [Massilia sp. Se16.2.3]
MSTQLISFHVDTKRVLEVLAKQIYQSPLALLRENTQNAYDAILLRRQRDPNFEPKIEITVTPEFITVSDNGIGMSFDEIRKNFWQAGSSSKNNEEARRAGVVGTFGIGAMANFGIADVLEVESESVVTGERTKCIAHLENLKFNQDCIETEQLSPVGFPGTRVKARIISQNQVSEVEAKRYVAEFVSLLSIDVFLNGELLSRQSTERFLPRFSGVAREVLLAATISSRLVADVVFEITQNADISIVLTELIWMGIPLQGQLSLRSGNPALRTFRSGFGLATVSVGSTYQFGGIADMLNFQPTAGREALTTDSMQLLQTIVSDVDVFASIALSKRPEADSSTPFMQWVASHRRFDLCGNLRILLQPGDRTNLSEIIKLTEKVPLPVYGGSDQSVITSYSSEDRPLLLLARSNPRRQCEQGFLAAYCKTSDVSDAPLVERLSARNQWSSAQSALAFRIENVLEADYFLNAEVRFGLISHGLALLVERSGENKTTITLHQAGPTILTILGLYDHQYSAFGSMVKDFVRTAIFPKVAEYVPSSTRQGAEAFLRAIKKPRDVFEYEDTDTSNLSAIWLDYTEGKISLTEAVTMSKENVRNSVQIVESSSAAQVRDVVPDLIANEETFRNEGAEPEQYSFDAAPAITRTEQKSSAKLLVISDDMPALRGYRCFIALTEKARNDMGDFFLQPHKTSVVWGGQKALFIFLHHSGQVGLYYDLQTNGTIASDSGGRAYPTCTIVLKDRIYIPVPNEIMTSFVPVAGERKRFEIRCDLLRVESEEE